MTEHASTTGDASHAPESDAPDASDEADAADSPADGDGADAVDAADAGDGGFETRVDDPDAVAATCRYCRRPFASTDAHALHVGDAHADVCTDREREAYERAADAEDESLFYFHLRVVAAIAALYTVLVLLYMIALGSGLL